jgi:hypothetical protein
MRSLAVAVALVAALPAAAELEIRPPDDARLEQGDAAFGRAVRKAMARGAAADVAILAEVMAGTPGLLAPEGSWSCRTLKLGGEPPLVVYGTFRCRIEPSGRDSWAIVKETGSQRLEGEIWPGDVLNLYLGVGFVGDRPATDYEGFLSLEQAPVEPGQTVPQVGIFEQMGPDRARLLLPSPLLESDYDIIYLTR